MNAVEGLLVPATMVIGAPRVILGVSGVCLGIFFGSVSAVAGPMLSLSNQPRLGAATGASGVLISMQFGNAIAEILHARRQGMVSPERGPSQPHHSRSHSGTALWMLGRGLARALHIL